MTQSVFEKIDTYDRRVLGFHPLGALWNVKTWRRYLGFIVIVCSLCWVFFGWDSVWAQLKPFQENLLLFLLGKIPLRSLLEEGRQYYGQGNHFSAPVLYGISFIYLSLYLEKVGIKKSYNFFVTTSLSLFSVGVFELTWNRLYSYFQGQTWAFTFRPKQINNLAMFVLFTIVGFLTIIYLYADGYRLNLSHRSLIFSALAISCWIFWVNYPFPVGHLEVETSVGLWENTNKFPQTYYAIDVFPDDKVAIGVPHHVGDNLIHFVNTGTKVVTILAILSLSMVKINSIHYQKVRGET